MIEEPAADRGHGQDDQGVGAFRSLFTSAFDAVRTRLDLVAVEGELFVLRIIRMVLFAFAAVACALLALAFAVVALVVALWDTHRLAGVLGGAGVFVLLAASFGFLASRSLRTRRHVLDGTLAQLEVDRQRLGGAS